MASRARSGPPHDAATTTKSSWAANACVVALTVAATLWAILGYAPGPERIAGTRGIALLLVVLYGAAHAIVLLRAKRGSAITSSPLRLSCLDLAIYWLLIYLLAPRFL